MTRDQALELRAFEHYCTCGGYAWSINGRDPMRPHMAWCPQRIEYNEWADALGEDGVRNYAELVMATRGNR